MPANKPEIFPQAQRLSDTLRVSEVFHSIQGESTWAGLPCTFIRLAKCHLRCTYCDTAYAFTGGELRSIEALIDACAAYDCTLVEITGGEPLLQPETPVLAAALLDAGYTVLVETSGSLPINVLPEGVIRIMDFKCPSSGEAHRNDWSNVDALTPRDEVKFVIGSREDYEWSRDVLATHGLAQRCKQVLFSLVFGALAPRDLVEWILADALPVRFQLQLHKFVWPPDQRGV
jgi:7-carboxy-7-deazaguanine synthase